jgi:putrescine transport system substrate-binding protein
MVATFTHAGTLKGFDMTTHHKRLLGVLGLALTCVIPALHAEDKTLRLYNWADYFAEDTLSRFTAETGIKVIYDVMDGSETLEAKMLSGGSGYDLIFPGDTVAERLMRAGSLMPLDPSKLTALADIEPGLQKLRSHYEHSSQATVPYTWGTIGLTYNAAQIKQRMADAPVNSLDMLFKPELAAKFADCGISMIDSPDEVLAVVLNYLGRDPRSAKPADLAAASEVLMKLRPYVRKFQSQPVTDLVNGNLCLSLGYSGDMTQAQRTSDSAGKTTKFEYRIPREGTTVWMDTMAIPVDAKHPDYAYAFINFVMRPENMAAISNFTGYPTSNAKARASVDAAMRNNPDIYLDEATYARLIPGKDIPQADMRARMRTWTKFKTATHP